MGKAKKKSSKGKSRGKVKGSSVFTPSALEYLSTRELGSEVVFSSTSHRMQTLRNQALDLSNRKQVQDFLEWTVQKPVLVLARDVFMALPFAQQLPVEDGHQYLLLTVSADETAPAFCLVLKDKIDVEHLEKCMGSGHAGAGETQQKGASTGQLSSSSRYDYWADFAATAPLNEQAKELMTSKGVKWKLLEHFAGEFPTVNVDGSVKQFLEKQQCEIAISKCVGVVHCGDFSLQSIEQRGMWLCSMDCMYTYMYT